ncbi:MAG: ATP-dependent metalloprotease, partial [Colwellia sp.]|nr:ATP-dependent metalloprotease [Colwellia sp.]
VYKVSIIPRGRALGVTMYLPEQDRFSHSKQHLESNISSLYGGRIAEDVIYGSDKVSTGASNDIERATNIARKMVTQWGLSDKMGPMLFAEEEGEVFLGRTSAKSLHMSDETAKAIDEEIKAVIDRNYQRAEKMIKDNMDILHAMKDALMKYETIDALQIDDLMARVEVRQPSDWDDSDSSSNSSSDSSEGGAAKKTEKAEVDEPVTTPDLSEPNSDTPAK